MAKKDLQKSQASRLWKSKLPTDQVAQCAPFLSKGLRVLCVLPLMVPLVAAAGLANVPGVALIKSSAGPVIWAVYGAVLLVLSRQIPDYRLPGTCTLASGAVSALICAFFPTAQISLYFVFLEALPFIMQYVGRYTEYKVHAAVLHDVNQRLARRWQRLWTWEIVYLVTFALFIAPHAAFAIVVAAVLGEFVINGARAVYLYQTANALLAFSQRYKAN